MKLPITEPIKALSWKQPWASLMLPPHNKIETRTWPTRYRGLVLICASKKGYPWDATARIAGPENWERILDMLDENQLSFRTNRGYFDGTQGHAIAVGNLVDCRPMTPADEQKCFVQYWQGLWCHIYADVTPIEPFPFKGSLGFRNLSQEDINLIRPIKAEWSAPTIKKL